MEITGYDIHINTLESFGNMWLDQDIQSELDSYQPVQVNCDVHSVKIIEPNTSNLVHAKIMSDVVVKANTQQLVRVNVPDCDSRSTGLLIFEPCLPMPVDCLVGRSLHKNRNSIYCNVVNTGRCDIKLEKDHTMGLMEEIENANIKFDEQVSNFQQLDLDKVREQASKLKFNPNSQLNAMIDNEDLTSVQRSMLLTVLSMHESVFQWDLSKLGRTKLVEHSVPTGDSNPIQRKQYPIPTVAMEEVRKQTAQMIKDKIIRPSKSPWRSPVLLVKKKDASGKVTGYRFCIDLTKVNEVTIKDAYALPLIGKTVDTLSGSRYFSNVDLDRAFWQVGLAEKDKEKFAFVLDGQLFEPNVMPFGSMNAPSTFQRLVDRVLHGLTWKQCLVYLDDVLIFSPTFEQHLLDIHETLSRFEFAGLMLKPSKCNFAKPEVDYLGFNISEHGIRASTKKLEAMANYKPPPLTKNLFSFLCSLNYYRKNIPRFGELTVALYKMCMEKKRLCQWSVEDLKNFAKLKQAFITAPILAFPDFTKPFIIHTDASDKGISAVLLQKFLILRPIAFSGRKLDGAEQRYSTSERELLGIVNGYEENYHYVYGRHIEFFTDHKPLVTMDQLKKPFGRLGRLFHRLAGVDYKLNYIPGAENFLADFLSRSFDPDTAECEANFLAIQSTVDWSLEQSKDPEVCSIISCIAKQQATAEWLKIQFGNRWIRENSSCIWKV